MIINKYKVFDNVVVVYLKNGTKYRKFKDSEAAKKWLMQRLAREGECFISSKEFKWHNPKLERILKEQDEK